LSGQHTQVILVIHVYNYIGLTYFGVDQNAVVQARVGWIKWMDLIDTDLID